MRPASTGTADARSRSGWCDEITTSDDYLLAASESADLYELRYVIKKSLGGRLVGSIGSVIDQLLLRLGDGRPASTA